MVGCGDNYMNALIVCDRYDDFLQITLPLNRHHFDRVVVVTSPGDLATKKIASDCGAEICETDLCKNGPFDLWGASETGLDTLGREGWICRMDADVVMPYHLTGSLQEGNLYGPRRRLFDGKYLPPEPVWYRYPTDLDSNIFAGYLQLFNASDLGNSPWFYSPTKDASTGDILFQARWPADRRVRPPWEVLHLGPTGVNWWGRVSPRFR